MRKKIFYILTFAACYLSITNGQNILSSQQDINNRVFDDHLRISFAKVGTVSHVDSSTYKITLSSSNTPSGQSAIAEVTSSDRLSIYLPGSYGGRMYLDSQTASSFFLNRVLVDSVNSGQQKLRREYWAVYAGMGMWDCVINCYTEENGKYYTVSLVQEKPMGKPGEIINGRPLTADELQLKIVSSLQDTTNITAKEFNKLLSSFQINN